MIIDCIKMHGLKNDYIYIDCINRSKPEILDSDIIKRLSDRHTGLGADGVVLILRSAIADFRMQMFNADGSEGAMCGNAIRCVGKYVADYGYTNADNISIETASGVKYLTLHKRNNKVESVTVNMGLASFAATDICLTDDREYVDQPLVYSTPDGNRTYRITAVSMGNPHCVIEVDNICTFPLERYGSCFENHPLFADRVNTEIVHRLGANHVEMRVWERGADETMACGTGACAVVAALTRRGVMAMGQPITVSLRGGDLVITCTEQFEILMTGSASVAYRGTIEI